MIVIKCSVLRLFELAVMLTGTTGQLVRAEEPQDGSESGNCARSAFRVLIDVGYTATSPGADSARGGWRAGWRQLRILELLRHRRGGHVRLASQ
jgi:hypothetical protein